MLFLDQDSFRFRNPDELHLQLFSLCEMQHFVAVEWLPLFLELVLVDT